VNKSKAMVVEREGDIVQGSNKWRDAGFGKRTEVS